MPSEREIEACVKALATLSKSAHVIDEVRGAVWEYYLTHPNDVVTPENKSLRRFLRQTLQLKAEHTDVSDTLHDEDGNTYSLIDLITGDEATPEAILIEHQTPAPVTDPDTEKDRAKNRFTEKRHLLTWRQEAMFQMQAAGESCAAIASYFGMTVNSIYMELYTARNRIKDLEVLQQGIPAVARVAIPRLRLAPLCIVLQKDNDDDLSRGLLRGTKDAAG